MIEQWEYIEPLQSITLFTTALCNLKCSYCYICKDNMNSLAKMDQEIKKDWEDNNYINRLKSDFSKTDLNNINHISLWGGEPLIGMDRFIPKVNEFKELLPNFNWIDFSTNLTLPNAVDIIEDLLNAISFNKNFTNKNWCNIDLQISIDGPEELNDSSRGKGVTSKILDNYNRLLKIKVPDNIKLAISTKPTLSMDSIESFKSLDYVNNYYKFFDTEFYEKYLLDNKSDNLRLFLGIANYAEPYDYTTQDGLQLAEVYKVFEEASHKNNFKGFYRRSLVPYVSRYPILASNLKKSFCYECGGACGKIVFDACLIPKNKYAVCHRSLFDGYVDYHNSRIGGVDEDYEDNCTFDLSQYNKLRYALNQIYHNSNKQIKIDMDQMINLHALAGTIDSKYLLPQNRLPVVNFMGQVAMCLDSNMHLHGSLYTQPYWWIKFLLNGAFDSILREIKRLYSK